jgi:hypothetical protein
MWPFSWFMKEDSPPPRGKTSWWPLIAFVAVLAFFGAKASQSDDPPPPTPVPHSTISPEDVEPLP